MSKYVLLSETAGFVAMLCLLWINELADLPHILGAPPTPTNWIELTLESLALIVIGGLSLLISRSLLGRIRHLEGYIKICAFCKRVCIDAQWIPIDSYLHARAEVDFTHGFCPDCAREHYGLSPSRPRDLH